MHSDTRELYNTLVLGGIILEADFWQYRSEHQQTVDKPANKQRVGWATALMADISPSDDGKTKRVKFSLSPETIQQIFSERQHVHRSYLEHVPHTMDDKEFWIRFCKHEVAMEVVFSMPSKDLCAFICYCLEELLACHQQSFLWWAQ